MSSPSVEPAPDSPEVSAVILTDEPPEGAAPARRWWPWLWRGGVVGLALLMSAGLVLWRLGALRGTMEANLAARAAVLALEPASRQAARFPELGFTGAAGPTVSVAFAQVAVDLSRKPGDPEPPGTPDPRDPTYAIPWSLRTRHHTIGEVLWRSPSLDRQTLEPGPSRLYPLTLADGRSGYGSTIQTTTPDGTPVSASYLSVEVPVTREALRTAVLAVVFILLPALALVTLFPRPRSAG